MVRIGIAGLGFMGRVHFLAAERLKGAAVSAVCSRDPAKLAGDWRNTRGNFGPEPGFVDLSGVARYDSFEAMIADPAIDLVDICSPTDTHADYAVAALRAGKHVLVEKAIALTTEEAGRMLAAADEAGRFLMVAHVLPFFPEFRFAADAIRCGQYGRLVGGHLTRVISRPDWSDAIADSARTGGPAVDLHVHDTHFIGLLAGVPGHVFSVGTLVGDAVTYLTTSYLYGPGGPTITCSSGAVAAAGRPFAHGFELYLETATLAFHSGGQPLTVFSADGTSTRPDLGDGDPIAAFAAELQAAADGVRTGRLPDRLSGQLARDALVLCQKEVESVKTGRIQAVAASRTSN